jgi:hypothetical protein
MVSLRKSHAGIQSAFLGVFLVIAVAVAVNAAEPDTRTQAEKEQTKKELDKLFKELFDPSPEPGGRRPFAVLQRHGAVEGMRIPGEWVEWRRDIGIFHKLGFHARGRSDVNVYSYFVWSPESRKDSEGFLQALKNPPHPLARDEIQSLKPVIDRLTESAPGEFDIRSAKTQDLNQRRVIVVEGRWTKHRVDAYTILVDASGCGKLAQQLAYTAPTADYRRRLADAQAAFASIFWRPAIKDFCAEK